MVNVEACLYTQEADTKYLSSLHSSLKEYFTQKSFHYLLTLMYEFRPWNLGLFFHGVKVGSGQGLSNLVKCIWTYMNGCKLRILNSNFSLFLTQDYHLTSKDSLNILKLFALYVVKKILFNFGYCKFYKIVQYGKTSLNIPLKIFFFLYSCFVPWKKVVRVWNNIMLSKCWHVF